MTKTLHVVQELRSIATGVGRDPGCAYRRVYLAPALRRAHGDQVVVELDGAEGYSTAFLSEAFGGLVAEFGEEHLKHTLDLRCHDEPGLVDEVWRHIRRTAQVWNS